jgi:pSer/pThr/pTyr-binding forkhead associated (FHA) protein
MTFTPDEVADDSSAALHDLRGKGPALVVRSGGGRAGESFFPSAERTLIGRSPECDVFLDDVTVSRKHAELVRDGETFTISDLGSLNGTFVNKKRIESTELEDDDELQIGKYRLTFLRR